MIWHIFFDSFIPLGIILFLDKNSGIPGKIRGLDSSTKADKETGVFCDHEKFKRSRMLLGKPAMERLENAVIAVIGLGAVGSHVIEALARSGVGTLRIVDFDQVSLSNFNRQLLAVEGNVGRLKTHAAQERLKMINPDMIIQVFNCLCHTDTFDTVFSEPCDLVIDAIDSLNPKVNLLCELVRRRIPVISCLGAARRVDPARIRCGDISETKACPLARAVRKRLRRFGIDKGIQCIYSDEVATPGSVSPDVEDNFGDNGRPRNPMGSLPMITGIFGYVAALEAVKYLVAPVYSRTGTDNPFLSSR